MLTNFSKQIELEKARFEAHTKLEKIVKASFRGLAQCWMLEQ